MTFRELVTVVKATIRAFSRDELGTRAAALTYYLFFSLFPLLLLALALVGLFLTPDEARQLVFNNATSLMPGTQAWLSDVLDTALKDRGSAGISAIIGALLLAFSASGAFGELATAINRVWNIEYMPNFFMSKVVSLVMMGVFAAVLLLSVLTTAVLSIGRQLTSDVIGVVPGGDIFWQVVNIAASLAVSFLVFMLMYWFVPRSKIRFKDIWLGALVAAVVWSGFKELFGYYIGSQFARFSAVYGTLGTVAALLTFIYISSLIILVGAEFSSEVARIRTLRKSVEC
ncbi:MAG: YihY/virulence factor BrkB family protein [Chloroflexota bacterium]